MILEIDSDDNMISINLGNFSTKNEKILPTESKKDFEKETICLKNETIGEKNIIKGFDNVETNENGGKPHGTLLFLATGALRQMAEEK